MRSEPVQQLGPITPAPALPPNAAVIASLVEDLAVFYDDGGAGLQQLMARMPFLLEVDRAYIARISPDGVRFTVTQTSAGDWPDLLGYTQSVARLPAFARGALQSGVQATVADAVAFPFTPQQRKMSWYANLGATVLTPIRSGRSYIGGLVVDVMRDQHTWEKSTLDSCKMLADAVGARIGLARYGDHLESEDRDPVHDMMRLNVLANIAQLLERSKDPAATTAAIVEALASLQGVREARLVDLTGPASALAREAIASERLVLRADAATTVAIPILFEGERFGAIELVLDGDRLSDVDEQFLRSVQVFTGSAFASALRRQRPRNEALLDPLTGLLNYRSTQEALVDAIFAAKSSNRPVCVWLLDIEGLDEINRNHGYAVGDDVVSFVGHTLGSVMGTRGSVGRLAGNAFLGAFPGMDADEGVVQGRMMVERLVKNVPGHLPEMGVTIGAAAFPKHASSADELVRFARLALFAAKSAGKNRVVVAQPADSAWLTHAQDDFIRIATQQHLPTAVQRIRR